MSRPDRTDLEGARFARRSTTSSATSLIAFEVILEYDAVTEVKFIPDRIIQHELFDDQPHRVLHAAMLEVLKILLIRDFLPRNS